MTEYLIELDRVGFCFDPGRPVLRALEFALGRGERVAVTGSNGCGKSTFLHLLVGLRKAREGTVRIFGRERRVEADFLEVRRRVGLVFQDADDQLFCPTVLEDVAFGPLNLGRAPGEARRMASATLDKVGLAGFEDRVTYRLSGGEKRLVALATVLSMDPEVLLLDEPLSGLDEEARERVVRVLEALPQSLVLVSHDRDLVGRIARRTLLLENGALHPVL